MVDQETTCLPTTKRYDGISLVLTNVYELLLQWVQKVCVAFILMSLTWNNIVLTVEVNYIYMHIGNVAQARTFSFVCYTIFYIQLYCWCWLICC